MNKLRYFLECYFYFYEGFDNLDNLIQNFKKEPEDSILKLTKELHQIIDTNNYTWATRFINKHGYRVFNENDTKIFVNYLYDKLIDKPTNIKITDLEKKCKIVLCPICSPQLRIGKTFSLIDKATIIDNNMQIYICRPCKLVWTTQKIKKDNAQDYKKFMRTLDLKGLWKELKDIDTL